MMILAIRFLGRQIMVNGRPYRKGHVFKRGAIPEDAFMYLSKRSDFEITERAIKPPKPVLKKTDKKVEE